LEQNIDQISLIHLCDSSDIKDGLGFGEGIMDMKAVCKVIDNSDFDGIVVLEVMPDYQRCFPEMEKLHFVSRQSNPI